MIEQVKILRVLKMISLLADQEGLSVGQLAEKLEVDKRTIYRYFHLLEACGFIVDQKIDSKHYFLHNPVNFPLQQYFDMEEVAAIRKAVAAIAPKDPLLQKVLTKIYEGSGLPVVKEALSRARIYQHIKRIDKAVSGKKQLILRSYHSSHSASVRDRLVEPVLLKADYSGLMAYEPESGQTKYYKLDRIAEVIIHTEGWEHEGKHHKLEQDIFGMSGNKVKWLNFEMSLRAYNLMREEIEGAVNFLVIEDNRYFFRGSCLAYEGIGRFILGLPGEIWNISDKALIKYIKTRLADYQL